MRERSILRWKGEETNDANAEGYRDDCAGCDCRGKNPLKLVVFRQLRLYETGA